MKREYWYRIRPSSGFVPFGKWIYEYGSGIICHGYGVAWSKQRALDKAIRKLKKQKEEDKREETETIEGKL